MSDEREVSEVPLYGGVEERLGPGVTEGRPVLVQQVHQLIAEESERQTVKWRVGKWYTFLLQ